MTKPRRNAREDILNTAERLFAENGIDNVSLRTINAEAGYSAAALHYHFRSREQLLEVLLLLRRQPIMALRGELLQALAAQNKPSAESLAEALVLPFAQLILSDPEGGLRAVKFLFRVYIEQGDYEPIRQTTQESLRIFDPLLALALPGVDKETRRTRWLMATELTFQGLANMETIMDTGSIRPSKDTRQRYVKTLTEFVAGGLQHSP
jgi:AcrR family transcriptional regulator